jgi:hypothetical protein
MAEAQARVEEAFEFHVPLDEGDDDAPATEDTGSEAAATEAEGEAPEQTEQPTEELLTAEEAGVDESSPEYQALRKKFIAAYQKKLEAERKKLKPREAAPEAQPVAEQPAAAAQSPESDDPFDAVYNVSFEGVKPALQFREGSDLADYADELNELFAQAVPQYIKAALDGVKNNDKQFRQRMTVAERETKARDVISKYAEEISDHPEYAEKAQALAEFANKTRQLAIDDPELWVEMAEKKYGLERGWRGASENEQAQEGQRNLRLASKTRSSVPRPTRSLPSLATTNGGMKFDAALSAAMRKAGL